LIAQVLLVNGSSLMFAAVASATPSIASARAVPMTAVVGVATTIRVEASITDPTLIINSVNLLQLGNGATAIVLGALHADGRNDDTFAGDGLYTITVTLTMPSAGAIQLQVSAAFRGVLQRIRSPTLQVFFQPPNAPQQALAAL